MKERFRHTYDLVMANKESWRETSFIVIRWFSFTYYGVELADDLIEYIIVFHD